MNAHFRVGKLSVEVLDECVAHFNIVFYLRKGSPFTSPLSQVIRGLKSGGLIDKWRGDEMDKVAAAVGGSKGSNDDDRTGRILRLKDLQIAFVTLFLGLGLALAVFTLEVIFRLVAKGFKIGGCNTLY